MPASNNTTRFVYALNIEIAPLTITMPFDTMCRMVVKMLFKVDFGVRIRHRIWRYIGLWAEYWFTLLTPSPLNVCRGLFSLQDLEAEYWHKHKMFWHGNEWIQQFPYKAFDSVVIHVASSGPGLGSTIYHHICRWNSDRSRKPFYISLNEFVIHLCLVVGRVVVHIIGLIPTGLACVSTAGFVSEITRALQYLWHPCRICRGNTLGSTFLDMAMD